MRRWRLGAAAAMLAAPCLRADVPDGDPRVTPVVRAYRRACPAVVNISTRKIITSRWGMFDNDLFDEIFPSPFVRRVPVQSLGSGFVIHPDGYLVTNAHVVGRAQEIAVAFADRSQSPARTISTDQSHDLAVLKIDPKGKALAHLPLGRSDDLMVGETVIAVGNPMGYSSSVTTGVVSATDRTLEFRGGVSYTGLIQTDAPINPGSSGGPLLNLKGELIGINTAIRADAQNIGFAIPVDKLAAELVDLLDFERINRVVFGARVVQKHGQTQDYLAVTLVREGTPAAGKLHAGDRVVSLNGRAVRQIPAFTCAMLAVAPGTPVRIGCLRDGRSMQVTVTLQAKPKPDGNALARRLFGMTLRPITPELARRLRLGVATGLLVVGVDAGGPAHAIGIALKDVLFQVGRYYVKDLEALGEALEDVQPGQTVRLGIARGSMATWVQLRAARRDPEAASGPRPRGGRP